LSCGASIIGIELRIAKRDLIAHEFACGGHRKSGGIHMGWLMDLLDRGKDAINEVQLAEPLRERIVLAEERIALAEAKYATTAEDLEQCRQRIADLERENLNLRAQTPSAEITLKPNTIRVLLYMFEATEMDDREVSLMASRLGMTQGVLQYHLDRLRAARLAHESAVDIDGVYWALTPDGRKYVMESVSQEMLGRCAMGTLGTSAMGR